MTTMMKLPLRPILWTVTVTAVSLLVAACAGSKPKPAPEPLKSIASIALLPVVFEEQVTPTKPQAGYVSFYQPVPSYVKGSPNAGIGAGIAVGAAAVIIANINEKRDAALRSAVAAIKFQPLDTLNNRVQELLRQKGINIEIVPEGSAVMAARHSGDYSHLPTQAEAVLDIRIGENGYYHSMRAGGFSPMLAVNATLASHTNVDNYDSFSYWSDYRENKDDPRWFTSSPASIFKTTDELTTHADTARAELDGVMEKMAVKLAEDIERRAAGQPSN